MAWWLLSVQGDGKPENTGFRRNVLMFMEHVALRTFAPRPRFSKSAAYDRSLVVRNRRVGAALAANPAQQ
jgi:hypothetical protein